MGDVHCEALGDCFRTVTFSQSLFSKSDCPQKHVFCGERCGVSSWAVVCRHWLYHSTYLARQSISLNLIHPRWLLDPQPLVDKPWIMGAEIQAVSEGIMNPGDRYRNQCIT